MELKQLLQDEDAVSPVIGVILMVAITVILAAVIGTFVLGLGDQVQSSAPNANFQFEYPDDSTANITHNGGQDVQSSNLEVQIGSENWNADGTDATGSFTADWSGTDVTISTGDRTSLDHSASAGADVRVIWQSNSGGSSNTIGSSTIPS